MVRKSAIKAGLIDIPEVVTAPRTDSVYNCHAYLTKVPLGAIRPFIEAFTRPGETVVDFFAGSGMTGLAAVGLGRQARLSDISALGQHIALGYFSPVDKKEFLSAAKVVVSAAKAAIGNLYLTKRATDDEETEVVRTVWSFQYRCPSCSFDLIYFNHLKDEKLPPDQCPSCNAPFARRTWGRAEDVPVEVVVRNKLGRLTTQAVGDFDRKMIAQAKLDPRQESIPSLSIGPDREMYSRSGLGKAGLTNTRQFFSPRNGIALLELWQAIQKIEQPSVRQKLSFSFTAILTRASRRYQWSAQRPLNAQNQTYYIAPVYYEWSIFELFERKIDAAIRAEDELCSSWPSWVEREPNALNYNLASADKIDHIKNKAADYVLLILLLEAIFFTAT